MKNIGFIIVMFCAIAISAQSNGGNPHNSDDSIAIIEMEQAKKELAAAQAALAKAKMDLAIAKAKTAAKNDSVGSRGHRSKRVIIIRDGKIIKNTLDTSIDNNATDSSFGIFKEKYEQYIDIWQKWADSMGKSLSQTPLPPLPPDINIPRRLEFQWDNMPNIAIPPTPGFSIPDNNYRSYKTFIHKSKPKAIIHDGKFQMGFAVVGDKNLNEVSGIPEMKSGKNFYFAYSTNWGLNLVKGKFRLWTGLQYAINNYRFSDSRIRLAQNSPMLLSTRDSINSSDKSKIVVNYIAVPVALGFQVFGNKKVKRVEVNTDYANINIDDDNTDGKFFIRVGADFGYRVRTHTKVKLDNGKTEKVFDDFNFNNVVIAPFVEFGKSTFGIFAKYNVTSLLKTNQGPDARALQFGILIH